MLEGRWRWEEGFNDCSGLLFRVGQVAVVNQWLQIVDGFQIRGRRD